MKQEKRIKKKKKTKKLANIAPLLNPQLLQYDVTSRCRELPYESAQSIKLFTANLYREMELFSCFESILFYSIYYSFFSIGHLLPRFLLYRKTIIACIIIVVSHTVLFASALVQFSIFIAFITINVLSIILSKKEMVLKLF